MYYRSSLEEVYDFLLKNTDIPKLNIHIGNLNLIPLSSIDYKNKISGAILGLAIGDIYNSLWRKKQTKEIGNIVYFLKDDNNINFINDTDQFKSVVLFAESLIINQYFDPEDLAKRFIRNTGLIKDKAVKQFVENYKDGKLEWYNSGTSSLDNSCVIRGVPAALINYGDFTELKLASALQAIITHKDEAAIVSSILFSTAVAYLLNTPAFALQNKDDINQFIDFLGRSIKGLETKVYKSDKNNEINNLYIMINNVLRQWFDENISVTEILKQWGCSSSVLESVPLALYIFIKNLDDYENILKECSSIRGKDSIITMVLTLLGAYLGFHNIPRAYTTKVGIGIEIITLSKRLFELSLKNKSNNPYRRMKERTMEEEYPQDELDKLLWSAIKYNKEEQYHEAIECFEDLLNKSSDFKKNDKIKSHIIESYGGYGNKLLEGEQYEEALRQFKKALIYDLNNPAILCDIAVTYFNMDNLDKAERYVRRAVEIAPEYEIGREILEAIKSLKKR